MRLHRQRIDLQAPALEQIRHHLGAFERQGIVQIRVTHGIGMSDDGHVSRCAFFGLFQNLRYQSQGRRRQLCSATLKIEEEVLWQLWPCGDGNVEVFLESDVVRWCCRGRAVQQGGVMRLINHLLATRAADQHLADAAVGAGQQGHVRPVLVWRWCRATGQQGQADAGQQAA